MKWLKINTVLLLSVLVFILAPLAQANTQFRIIVDASGSMLISDPDKLTPEALRLISQLAPEDESTLGVWLFGEAPRVLFPEAKVSTQTKAKLANFLRNYTTEDVQTDLEAIIRMLLDTPDSGDLPTGFNRHWILVTDGMVDISLDETVNQASRERILNILTAQLVERGVHLHTISIAGHTDKELLQSMSLQTNATHTEVVFPDDLLDTFDRIFNQASPSEELPISGNQFFVDTAIKELTLVMFHDDTLQPSVVMPNGRFLTLEGNEKVAVSKSDHYTLITIRNPDVGRWGLIDVDLSRSSVKVITDLSVQPSSISPVMFTGEAFRSSLGLYEQGAKITQNDLLDLVTVSQTLFHQDGDSKQTTFEGGAELSNGQFVQNYDGIQKSGLYELVSVVDGKTFSRQLVQQFTVHPAIDLQAVPVGNETVRFSAKPSSLRLNLFASDIRLSILHPNGSTESLIMPLVGKGYWEINLPIEEGSYTKVNAALKGVTQSGQAFEYHTPQWSIGRDIGKTPFAVRGDIETDQSIFAALIAQAAATPALAKAVPVTVAPSIFNVDDFQQETTLLKNSEAGDININNRDVEKNIPTESVFSSREWILYAVLNLGGLLVIGGGILLYRRMKKNTTT